MAADGREVESGVRFAARQPAHFPYVPGLFAYREGPAITSLLDSLPGPPDLLVFHAQGIAHPRGIGLAAHIGLLYDTASYGITRKRLFGAGPTPPIESDFSVESLRTNDGKRIGVALRFLSGFDPVYASPGHRMDLESMLTHLKAFSSFRGCLPTGLCLAQEAANRMARSPSGRAKSRKKGAQ